MPPIKYTPLRDPADVRQHAPALAHLVYETGAEYFDWLFNGREHALATLAGWVCRADSQYAGLRATVALTGAIVAGAFVAMPGGEVRARQRSDFLALIKAMRPGDRAGFHDRIAQLRTMETPVEPDQFYIRTLSVAGAWRGRGLGRELLGVCFRAGHESGFRRFRLDVRTDNLPAVRLYTGCHFRRVGAHTLTYSGRPVVVAAMVAEP